MNKNHKKECQKGVRCSNKSDCEFDHSMYVCPAGSFCKFREYDKCIFYHASVSNRCRNGLKCIRIKSYKCRFFHPNEEIPCIFADECNHFKTTNKCAFAHDHAKKSYNRQEGVSKISFKEEDIKYVKKESANSSASKRTGLSEGNSSISVSPHSEELSPQIENHQTISDICIYKEVDGTIFHCKKCNHPKTSRFDYIFRSKYGLATQLDEQETKNSNQQQ